jgi:hypothetical protein
VCMSQFGDIQRTLNLTPHIDYAVYAVNNLGDCSSGIWSTDSSINFAGTRQLTLREPSL